MIPELQTNRFLMRPFVEEDADNLFSLNLDPEVVKFTGNKGYKDKQEALEFIRTYDQYAKYKVGRMIVLEKNTGEFAGWCGLKFLEEINETDLGYRFLKKFWGQGIATETSIAVLDYGFLTLGLKKIVGRVVRENIASKNVLKKLGMVFEKEFEAHGYNCEQYVLDGKTWKSHRILLSGI